MASAVAVNKQSDLTTKGVAGLIRTAWEKKIQYAAVKADPMVPQLNSALVGTIDPGKVDKKNRLYTVPGKLIQNISPEGDKKYARETIIQMTMPLSGNGYQGRTDPAGNEENIALKFAKVYANDLGHATGMQEWGIDGREAVPTRYQNQLQQLLGTWRGEKEGLDMRTALLLRKADNLTEAPTSQSQFLNPNCVAVDNTATPSFVSYSATGATFDTNVGTALNALSASTVSHLTISFLIKLCTLLKDGYIRPFIWEGHRLYCMYVSDDEMDLLEDPAVANTWGNYIKDVASFGKMDIHSIIPNASFIVKEQLILIRDDRSPVVGITAGNAYNAAFMGMGRTDNRPAIADPRIFNANLVMGENALIRHAPEPWHFKYQKDNYDKYSGVSYNAGMGYQIGLFDIDTPTDSSLISEGSAVVFTAKNTF